VVIEAVNGLIKRWKALALKLVISCESFALFVIMLFDHLKLRRAMNRKIVAERMLRLVEKSNQLKLLETENWTKQRVIWQKMEVQILKDFLKLTLNELRNLTLDIYQIKQAKSYTEEHLNDSKLYELLVHKERSDIIHVQSRHTSSKIYNA